MLSKNNWRVVVGTVWYKKNCCWFAKGWVLSYPGTMQGTKLRNLRQSIKKSGIKRTLRDKGGILSGNTLMH